jgi:hypothetical protein
MIEAKSQVMNVGSSLMASTDQSPAGAAMPGPWMSPAKVTADRDTKSTEIAIKRLSNFISFSFGKGIAGELGFQQSPVFIEQTDHNIISKTQGEVARASAEI